MNAFLILVCIWLVSIFGESIENNDDIVKLLPKIDLHAHLHGSIRTSTLKELAHPSNTSVFNQNKLDLSGCFYLFSLVHKAISSRDVLRRIVSEVLDDYMNENTIYLELRSTPRSLADGTTAREYVQELVRLIEAHNILHGERMLVKLILSIDRSKSITEANEVLLLATDTHFYDSRSTPSDPLRIIVGLDFSGNPLGGRYEDFAALFDQARDHGLKITVHTAETRELSEVVHEIHGEDETGSILKSK